MPANKKSKLSSNHAPGFYRLRGTSMLLIGPNQGKIFRPRKATYLGEDELSEPKIKDLFGQKDDAGDPLIEKVSKERAKKVNKEYERFKAKIAGKDPDFTTSSDVMQAAKRSNISDPQRIKYVGKLQNSSEKEAIRWVNRIANNKKSSNQHKLNKLSFLLKAEKKGGARSGAIGAINSSISKVVAGKSKN